jgi:hypothetical protein
LCRRSSRMGQIVAEIGSSKTWSGCTERTPTTTGNACTGNARLPGGKAFAQGAVIWLRAVVWLRSAFRSAVCAGAMKIGVPPMGLAVRMELGRLAFRREGWRSAWKYNAGRSHLLPYDAGLIGSWPPIDWRFAAIDCDDQRRQGRRQNQGVTRAL